MAADCQTLENRYLDSCKKHSVQPNKAVLNALFQAKMRKAHREASILMVLLDDLKDEDFHPLHDFLMEVDKSTVDAVDLIERSSCTMSGEHLLALLRTVKEKLRVVDLQDISFGKEFLLDLAQRGLTCQILYLRSSHFRKLNTVGKFMQMHTLNLDFSSSLTSFREDCFAGMPNLKFLSLCETRISNLWTTSAALAKLPSLVELRFQPSLCCDVMHNGPSSSGLRTYDCGDLGQLEVRLHSDATLLDAEDSLESYDVTFSVRSEDSSDDSEVDFSSHTGHLSLADILSDVSSGWNELDDLPNEISFGSFQHQDDEEFFPSSSNSRFVSDVASKKCSCRHASPICYEKHYRDYMITSLPNLEILDNLRIEKTEKAKAGIIFAQHFEYLPYRRKKKESIVTVLHNREIRTNHCYTDTRRQTYSSRRSPYSYSRSLSAAKVGSSAWPALHSLSLAARLAGDERKTFRPRQFEYHPSDASLMVFGTLDGEVVVINHEIEKIVSYIPSFGSTNSILGLCWLKSYPTKLIAGADNGSLRLYDVKKMATTSGVQHEAAPVSFDGFEQLTSVHVNSTDELFITSGYSKHVALYDISTAKRLQVFADMHREHINVVKFSNHSPSVFATSSFDQDVKMWDLRQKPHQPCYTATSARGNVMVCFSPDDQYLLVSAVDNEVRQLLAVDGRLHLDFDIPSTGSSQNYTRSYYMNGRDYVISGSCDEHTIRICCAQTGRRLRDVSLEGKGSGTSMFVQSLRGDPFRDFNLSVLAAYIRPFSNSEIVKVNLLAVNDYSKLNSCSQQSRTMYSMGG